MDNFLKLVSFRYDDNTYDTSDSDNDSNVVVPLTRKQKIVNALKNMSINEVHIATCFCGCREQESLWNNIPYGVIDLDILQFLIDEKYIDLANEEIRNKLLQSLASLLSNSGIENNEGMSDRIHETTLFLFTCLGESILTFRGHEYGESLIHSAFYGHHHERKNEYIMRMLDLGCPLSLTNAFYENDEGQKQLDELPIRYCGQSPIYLAADGGHSEILERMLNIDQETVKIHLQSYDSYYCSREGYAFVPIVPRLLLHYAGAKKSEWLIELSKDIKTLIKYGYDIHLPIYSGNTKNQHNITDYLRYYQYDYLGSPIMELFDDLPEALDPEFKNFQERERSRYDNDYDMVLRKYQYLKDPTKYHLILTELETLLQRGVPCEGGFGNTSWWSHVPGLDELKERVREFERTRVDRIMAFRQVNHFREKEAAA